MRTILMIISFIMIFCSNASAGSSSCDVGMFLIDCNPEGVILRDGPDGDAAAVIPYTLLTPYVNLYREQDGWFQINQISIADGEDNSTIELIAEAELIISGRDYGKEGIHLQAGERLRFSELQLQSPLWLPADKIDTDYRVNHLLDHEVGFSFYSAPSDNASMTPIGIDPNLEDVDCVKFIGCSGDWLQVLFTSGKHKGKTGWISPQNQCKNPNSTCP